MKITKSQLKQLVKEEIEAAVLQEQEVMTVQKQIQHLAKRTRDAAQDRLDLRMAIEDLNRRMAELEKGM